MNYITKTLLIAASFVCNSIYSSTFWEQLHTCYPGNEMGIELIFATVQLSNHPYMDEKIRHVGSSLTTMMETSPVSSDEWAQCVLYFDALAKELRGKSLFPDLNDPDERQRCIDWFNKANASIGIHI